MVKFINKTMTRENEAHNAVITIDIYNSRKKQSERKLIGTLIKSDEIFLIDLDEKAYFNIKIIFNFFAIHKVFPPFKSTI